MSFLSPKKAKLPNEDEKLREARRLAYAAEVARRGRGATLLTGPGLGDVAAPTGRPLVYGTGGS